MLHAIYDQYEAWNRYLMTKLDPVQLNSLADALKHVGQTLAEEVAFFHNGNWPIDKKGKQESNEQQD